MMHDAILGQTHKKEGEGEREKKEMSN